MAESDKTIVSRIQHRRGLKQDLPQPLRPGELGLATDRRQIYIGGDPNNPATADYHSVSYYENTLSAKEHVTSIANNNIMAFKVPCVIYTEGEFNGSSNQKSWQPTDARSIISGISQKAYSDSTYAVFSPVITQQPSSTLASTKAAGSLSIAVTAIAGQDTLGNIRVQDEIIFDPNVYSGARPQVVSIAKASGSNNYDITIDRSIAEIASGTSLTFVPRDVKNIFTGTTFTSKDVTVVKNSIKQTAESSTATTPGANSEYALDASNVSSVGSHVLNLRTAPTTKDSVALSYYSNANVISIIEGVASGTKKGNVSAYTTYPSFYQNSQLWTSTNGVLPSYKRFKPENIQVSASTGVGFVGMDLIHISSTADGANLATTTGKTFGNLYIARNDQQYATTGVAESVAGEQYQITMADVNQANLFETMSASGPYKYDQVMFKGSTGNTDEYFHNSKFQVTGHTVGSTVVTISLPSLAFTIGRPCNATLSANVFYSGNQYQNQSPIVQTVVQINDPDLIAGEVKVGDYVRLVDTTGGSDTNAGALNDRLFKVKDVRNGSFDIRLDNTAGDIIAGNSNVTAFNGDVTSQGNLKYINHGAVANVSQANSTFQIRSVNHGINVGGVSNVKIDSAATFVAGTSYDINSTNDKITSNTFFIENFPGNLPTGSVLAGTFGAGGLISDAGSTGVKPQIATSFASGAFSVVPVLSIDLSSNTTVADAITTVNKNLVEINGANVQIYPQMNWIPHDDNTKNAVYIYQRPAYSSVATGGLEFTLFEDDNTATLSSLGLQEGSYDRANNSVKAKFESWMNGLVNSRDVNVIANAFPGGATYATLSPKSNNISTNYNLTIDNTFDEITFGSREEAGIFNNIVNRIYGTSLYDKLLDKNSGSRGLINLKNNIEISTRELATFGNKVTSFNSMEEIVILQGDNSSRVIASFDVGSTYNVYSIEYSIRESTSGAANKYIRTGTWSIAGRTDFTDVANAVVFADRFSSHYEVTTHNNTVIEPKFKAVLNSSSGLVEIRLVDDQLDTATNTTMTHNLGVPVKLKYIVNRWAAL